MSFWLIETENQLNKYFNKGYKEAFVEVIPFNPNSHPQENEVSVIYVRPLNAHKGYIFPLNHSETLSLKNKHINEVLDNLDKVYVRDKKEFLHYYIKNKSFDLTLSEPYNPKLTQSHHYFYGNFHQKHDINRIIPITKHYEYCEIIFNELKPRINENINKFYNNKASVVFNAIERMGIRISRREYDKFYPSTENEEVYTQYNFKTTTTRPSNHFNKINFAALNKENGCRKSFIPKNDKYVEFDITAYHPTILANLIGYSFSNPDIHGEFAKMYGVDYAKSKQITFQMIYGGIFEQYKDLEFFKQVQIYTDELWGKFQNQGYIKDKISGFRFEKNKLDNMNPSKLLNYLIQQQETVNNINIIWEILKILRGKNSELILYTYDSFLVDHDETEQDILEQIKNVFILNNLQIKEKSGYNYHDIS